MYIETKLETCMGLKVNREKTQVVNLREKGVSLDFLGYTFRYDRSLDSWGQRYWNVTPSKMASGTGAGATAGADGYESGHKPLSQLFAELNRHLKVWGNYFSFGYPRAAYGRINSYVRERLFSHLRRRSQRPFRPPDGVSYNAQFARMGLRFLSRPRS